MRPAKPNGAAQSLPGLGQSRSIRRGAKQSASRALDRAQRRDAEQARIPPEGHPPPLAHRQNRQQNPAAACGFADQSLKFGRLVSLLRKVFTHNTFTTIIVTSSARCVIPTNFLISHKIFCATSSAHWPPRRKASLIRCVP